MVKVYNKSIFIFRRDHRLDDNIGLIEALNKSIHVIPIFIFTPEQLINNKFKSDNCVQFMIESLEDLDKQLKKKGSRLFYFFGKPCEVVDKIVKKMDVNAVFVNRDYTPYSKIRDEKIKEVCDKNNIVFESHEDVLLQPVGSIRNGSGEIYKKFTPFFNTAKKIAVKKPIKNTHTNYLAKKNKIVGEFKGNTNKFYQYNDHLAVHGGRDLGLKIVIGIKKFKKYNDERNTLATPTTKLSAYIKFGCVSIREVYQKMKSVLGAKNDLIKQLYWREFYHNILEYYPNTLSLNWKEKNLKDQYKKVKWLTYETANAEQKKQWHAWCDGKTGYPVVDAAMRELNVTGFMHNRGRLIVSSFLVKNMFFHYAEGEKYFAQHLVDYDPANNIGGWAWISGSSVDSQQYFRVLSPISQSLRFDTDCLYIKKWIPELKDVPNEHIHEWGDNYDNYPDVAYPKPILDYSETAKKVIKKYKEALY